MGNLEVGRNAALLGGTRREKKGLQEIGNSNTGPLLHVMKSKNVTKRWVCQQHTEAAEEGGTRTILASAVGGHSATRWSPRFGDKHS